MPQKFVDFQPVLVRSFSCCAFKNTYRINYHKWHNDLTFWCCWHFLWHKYLFLGHKLFSLRKKPTFAGNPHCGAACTNCFEKWTNWCANVNDESRNATKATAENSNKPLVLLSIFFPGSSQTLRHISRHARIFTLWSVECPLSTSMCTSGYYGNHTALLTALVPLVPKACV